MKLLKDYHAAGSRVGFGMTTRRYLHLAAAKPEICKLVCGLHGLANEEARIVGALTL